MSKPLQTNARRPRAGSSLVIVLATIALITVLLVAFLSSVKTELQSSKVYASGSSLKLLAQSSVNLVIGQIRVATADASLCWASQPGMVRTYGANGQPAAFYKLYSDAAMQGSGSFDAYATANAVPANWASAKGLYTDLNQPVLIGGTEYYPIVDGSASNLANYTSVNDGGVKALAPVSGSRPAVEGYWLKSSTAVDSTSPNQAPMPVRWLYALQNGEIIVPDSNSTGGNVTFNNAGTKPSKDNQIVGRIAFWTDDETCKVNVNTASEGTFWDAPRSWTDQDYYLATRQPAQGEYQRYPGHPATVSLSTIFGMPNAGNAWQPDATFTVEDFYPLTPYANQGGSRGGTVSTDVINSALSQSVRRLYASTDEFVFQQGLSSGQRALNASLFTAATDLDSVGLKKRRFFLTTHSQSPDVNIHNLPRVSMWPITLDRATANPVMTPFDKLIAFAGTINDRAYYFQRKDPNSPTEDLPVTPANTGLGRNRALINYLNALTTSPNPGFSPSSFQGKYGDDQRQIVVEIFDYIRSTNLQDTSTGATTYAKPNDTASNSPNNNYLGGQGQVVPILDTAQQVTDTLTGENSNPRGFGRFPTVHQAFLMFIGAGDNKHASYNPTINTHPGFSGYTYVPVTADGVQRVQAGFFLQMYDPSNGVAITYPWYEIDVEGLDSLSWSNEDATSYSMRFPSAGTITKPWTCTSSKGNLGGSSNLLYGGMADYRTLTYLRGDPGKGNKYPFITPPTGSTSPSNCPDMSTSIYFKGGTATVKVYALKADGSRIAAPVQTIELNFPAGVFPMPQTVASSPDLFTYRDNPNGRIDTTNMRSFYSTSTNPGRLDMMPNIGWIGSTDVVRALVATPGDMRLTAARTKVPADQYKGLTMPGVEYASSSEKMSHMLRYGLNFPVYGTAGGKLATLPASPPGSNYARYLDQYDELFGPFPINDHPALSSGNSISYYRSKDCSVPTRTGVRTTNGVIGDWDNGIANCSDGAYINKADEGDARGSQTNYVPYFQLDYGQALPGPTFFTANRMIPSSGMLGSLPTGVWANKPWQTLLFRPGPADHPGLGGSNAAPYPNPPDHLIMDLFNMPVVEPYAISTPLATAGRVNMNYQIVPFTYIHRDTAVRAAMKAQMITAFKTTNASSYKSYQNVSAATPDSGNQPSTAKVRFPINIDATLSQFEARFTSRKDIFRSASEICSIDLVPKDPTAPSSITRSSMDNYWSQNLPTGDNTRERPYTTLYPLLTTKSNTYTVHYRVQLLKQTPSNTTYETWREGKDSVLGQHRGSQTIERYIDPQDNLPDYATSNPSSADPLSDFYKFRVVATRQFTP
jgi:uncharacterized protein (TIGR02600 family)